MHVYLTLESYLDLLLSAFAGAVRATHTYILYIYIKWCAATLTRWHPLGSHIACWTGSTSFDMLMRTFYVLCLCLRENVCVSVHVFYSFAQEQEGDASDVLYFHSGVLLWGKRIPWKLNISLWLAADKDWIICVLLKSPFNFFFNRDERFCLRCPGSCVPCCLVISEINSSTSPSCA